MKIPKTSPITSKTKLLSFDLETNGLHGQAFAVGGVLMDSADKTYSEFSARIPIDGKLDEWVEKNVLPSILDMCEAFWEWYVKAEPESDYVLVNNGYPVEYRFLLDCQEASLDERYWQHPFPILDLSSLLIMVGHKPLISRTQLLGKLSETYLAHHPLHDAKVAILTAFEAFHQAGQIT
jgi:hypothetical protein